MSTPTWYAQPFRPDGGITAEGLRNQLGRPSLSVLTVLVRESAQNSWDAKQGGDVDYQLDLVTVSPAHRQAWVQFLVPGVPNDSSLGRSLPEVLRSQSIRYLAVSDRGTTGLGGPTRSDVHAEPNKRAWLSFVLNSGEKQDVDGGGGTYGYGKGAFFLASRVGTVLIYTRFRDEAGGLRSRLIGSSLLSSVTVDEVPYTGRYWWGRPSEGHCEPLKDQDADMVARALGLPDFRGEETGTTVVVLDPNLADPLVEDLTEMTVEDAGRFLADAAAWNLWPLTLEDRDSRLRIAVTAHGAQMEVPSERTDAVLANFAAAYRAMRTTAEPNIRCGNPKKMLGRFGYVDTFGAKVISPAAQELGLSGSPHHVCCMRRPDLVVQYLEQPAKAHPDVGYAGVFKVEDDLDAVFAKAEPPTHDAWIDAQLAGREATFVRVYRRRLNEESAKIVGPKAREAKVVGVPVGPVAQRLGFLLAGIGGTGAAETVPVNSTVDPPAWSGPPQQPGGSGDPAGSRNSAPSVGGRKRQRPVLVGRPMFRSRGGRHMLAQKVRIFAGTSVRGTATVITGDGSAETAGPVGSAQPQIIGWSHQNMILGGEIFVAGAESVEVDLLISAVEDAAIDIGVEVVP
ncbi:hypothetical protein [Paractinoplanes brasiliensis]|uniref:Uncharacterized protein n=1 Tax=Paractinoplanes brasiliensis TaxID=52695 RepID=A0A4R6JSY6_9ACTN|nr:hypothetical protein [Actinoplanes brasiliensis]TDO39734.1 hypothetical protein C8E87_3432 [Actinoplanes brasiliensis]GID28929.1 hypothetical protein Abr02nite_39120 [Actinoplanes brasiliensis]